jgi:phosphopantetheinyl transferase
VIHLSYEDLYAEIERAASDWDGARVHRHAGRLCAPAVVWWRAAADLSTERAERDKACLSIDELKRADNTAGHEQRSRFVDSRARLRRFLGKLTDTEPGCVVFDYSALGKPVLKVPACDIAFNWSHSGECYAVVLLFESRQRIGIDIQCTTRLPRDLARVARWVMCSSELREFEARSKEQAIGYFCRTWCRKEAVLKALGTGLSEPMRECRIAMAAGLGRFDMGPARAGTVLDILLPGPMYGAVAITDD